jgi:hypothetical protein
VEWFGAGTRPELPGLPGFVVGKRARGSSDSRRPGDHQTEGDGCDAGQPRAGTIGNSSRAGQRNSGAGTNGVPSTLNVFDSTGHTNLTEIAASTQMDAVGQSSGTAMLLFNINTVGGTPASHIDGGYFVWTGKFKAGTNECPNSVSGSIQGTVHITDTTTGPISVLVPKGKLSTGALIPIPN